MEEKLQDRQERQWYANMTLQKGFLMRKQITRRKCDIFEVGSLMRE
jgi:hypothetical protein